MVSVQKMVTYFSEICFKGLGFAGLLWVPVCSWHWLSRPLNCGGLLFPFPLWLGGGCFWWMEEKTHKVNNFFFLIGKHLWLICFLLRRCLWLGGQGWLSSQKAAFSGLTEQEFAAFFFRCWKPYIVYSGPQQMAWASWLYPLRESWLIRPLRFSEK